MIHLLTGDGKGKTTASIGLLIRALGRGWKVLFMQFLKDSSSGEINILKNLKSLSIIHASVNYGFTFQMTQIQLNITAEEYKKMIETAYESNAQLIVLDEVIYALDAGLLEKKDLEKLLSKDVEIVLTGGNAPEWLIEKADYVSNIQKIKHPYDKGIVARKGIEY